MRTEPVKLLSRGHFVRDHVDYHQFRGLLKTDYIKMLPRTVLTVNVLCDVFCLLCFSSIHLKTIAQSTL